MCQKQRFQEGAAAGRSLRELGTRIQVTGPLFFIQPSLLPAGAGFMHCSRGPIRAREPRPPRPKAQGTLKSCPGTEGQEAQGTREVLTTIVQVGNDSGLDWVEAAGWRNALRLKTNSKHLKGQGVAPEWRRGSKTVQRSGLSSERPEHCH